MTSTGLASTAALAFGALALSACTSGGAGTPHASQSTPPGSPASTSPTAARASLTWSAPQHVDLNKGGLTSVSCVSPTFCVAVGGTGRGVPSTAVVWNGTAWSAPQSLGHPSVNHVSCVTPSFCLAGAPDGTALEWNGTRWSPSARIRWPNANDGIVGVSCATARFCVAPDEDGDMRVWKGSGWSVEFRVGAYAVSCPTARFCMGVRDDGATASWNGTRFAVSRPIIRRGRFAAMSCATPAFCLALASGDSWLTWDGRAWSAQRAIGTVRPQPNGPIITWVSCATSTFCVATLSDGETVTWSAGVFASPQSVDPALRNARGPVTTSSPTHPAVGLQSVSCPTATFCVAVGTDGNAEIGRGTTG